MLLATLTQVMSVGVACAEISPGLDELASKIMRQHQIAVGDVYAFIISQYDEMEKHPEFTSYVDHMAKSKKQPPHKPVAEALSKPAGAGQGKK